MSMKEWWKELWRRLADPDALHWWEQGYPRAIPPAAPTPASVACLQLTLRGFNSRRHW